MLDEPTLGLDVIAVKEVVDMVSRLKEVGKTIIIASHSMTFVEEVADRVALITDGRIIEVEKVETFIEMHGNPRYLLSYKRNYDGNLCTETFDDPEQCNARLQKILSQGIEICEFRKECDTLEQILRRLLSAKGE